jgi:catechol 2,3-dioxygenase-like lactoylglutathione lyase family enzyme
MITGLTGVEHVSTSVPDVDAAVAFFVDVLGARVVGRERFAGSDDDVDMAVTFNAHPDASAELVTLDLHGVRLELFCYDAPDLVRTMPRNCDVGGHHLGMRVDDLPAAVAELAAVPGVRILGEPTYYPLPSGLHRGWVYFLTPWGLQMELAEERPEPRLPTDLPTTR